MCPRAACWKTNAAFAWALAICPNIIEKRKTKSYWFQCAFFAFQGIVSIEAHWEIILNWIDGHYNLYKSISSPFHSIPILLRMKFVEFNKITLSRLQHIITSNSIKIKTNPGASMVLQLQNKWVETMLSLVFLLGFVLKIHLFEINGNRNSFRHI